MAAFSINSTDKSEQAREKNETASLPLTFYKNEFQMDQRP